MEGQESTWGMLAGRTIHAYIAQSEAAVKHPLAGGIRGVPQEGNLFRQGGLGPYNATRSLKWRDRDL